MKYPVPKDQATNPEYWQRVADIFEERTRARSHFMSYEYDLLQSQSAFNGAVRKLVAAEKKKSDPRHGNERTAEIVYYCMLFLSEFYMSICEVSVYCELMYEFAEKYRADDPEWVAMVSQYWIDFARNSIRKGSQPTRERYGDPV
jgi:hypothetical protein